MQSGPRMMYQTQAVAFNARNEILGKATDSTPITPPSVPAIDLNALCKLKRDIVSNLPKNCLHCGAEYPIEVKGTFVERDDGSIMAYCKQKGACGRSHVLFAGVELVKPVYEQVCVFTYKGFNSAPLGQKEEQAAIIKSSDFQQQLVVPKIEQQQFDPSDLTAISSIDQIQASFDMSKMTHDEMMELHDPTCAKCGLRKLAHKTDIDKNGWRVARKESLSLPADWPTYYPSTAACNIIG